jgi:transcriptional regulator with PAS, ATPase and Fis domain
VGQSLRTQVDSNGSSGSGIGEAGLLLVSGDGILTTHALRAPEIVIGRAPECDIVVPHKSLSRRHVLIRLGPPLTVQDLGSTNGTRVARLTLKGGDPAPLAVGESFHIGKLSFVVLRAARASQTADDESGLLVLDPTEEGASPLVRDVAGSGVNVLILGETGVGKEVLAETLHSLSGRKGPLMKVNCAALSPTLLESELFGHEKGAFTGAQVTKPGLLEAAEGGTAFLDEIGELPEPVQVKLLRALESREVMRVGAVKARQIDVRFASATNRDLPAEVAAGAFRSDLYYRLDGITLVIPPLRERRHQIGRLSLQFLRAAHDKSHGKKPLQIAPELLQKLEAHDWPGNVRELRAALERAVLLARGGEIGWKHLALAKPAAPRATKKADPEADPERQQILDALEACAGNQTRAAKILGISRATLVNKLAIHRIPRPRK